jgi:hypothetical protein
MTTENAPREVGESTIRFNLGTFEGFNFRTQCAIMRILTAAEVVAWDHDEDGEAEFWPSGDRPEVSLVFKRRAEVTGSELLALDRLLEELGGDSPENFLRIYHALDTCSDEVGDLSREAVEDQCLHIFLGSNFIDLRREAAYELFELYYPDEYRTWEKSTCDGLIFDTDVFLDSPSFYTAEIALGDQKAILVAPN